MSENLLNKIKEKAISISIVALVLLTIFGIIVALGAQGSLTVEKAPDSPSRNIANTSQNYVPILKVTFRASGENINITNMTIKDEGSIDGVNEITDVGIGLGISQNQVTNIKNRGDFPSDNDSVTLDTGGIEVSAGGSTDVYIYINTSAFALGTDSIVLNLTGVGAVGFASGATITPTGLPVVSNTIYGAGNLTIKAGNNDIVPPRYVNAGNNTTGYVIQQINFTAYIEGATITDVTLSENGTANGSIDFSGIYLVNDTNGDGDKDTNDYRVSDIASNFGSDNGSVKLSITTGNTSEKTIPLNGSINYLVVVTTTKSFWSGETLAVNVSDFNATGADSLKGVGRSGIGLASNATTGQARIEVAAGSNQPGIFYSADNKYYVKSDVNKNLENLQVNFTAIAGKVNITAIMVEQTITANKANTYPKIYLDEDGDGKVTSIDTRLNVSASISNLNNSNVTLSNYNVSNAPNNFTFMNRTPEGIAPPIYAHVYQVPNGTSSVWHYNVSINYATETGATNITYFNLTNGTVGNGDPTDRWINIGITDLVTNVTNIVFQDSNNVDVGNTTMGNYNTSVTTGPANARNFTDGSKTLEGVSYIDAHIINVSNSTEPWWYKVNINYTNTTTGTINMTSINITTGTVNDTWISIDIGGDTVYDIVNITNATDLNNVTFVNLDIVSRINYTFDIVATRTYRYVTLDTNITIGNESETDAGQESKNVIIAVNTTSGFDVGTTTRAMINTSKYGNWSNYIAYDSELERRIFNSNDTPIDSVRTLEALGFSTGWKFNVTQGQNQPSANIGIGTNLVPVLQLNYTLSDTVDQLDIFIARITDITISENGTANVTGNITSVGLVIDKDGDGLRDSDEPLIAGTGRDGIDVFTRDNGSVKLTPSSPIELNNTVPYRNILVVVNVSSSTFNVSDPANNTLWFNLTNPSIDYNIKSRKDAITTDFNETPIIGNQLYATGSISASSGANTPADGTISSRINTTFLVLQQINFTAGNGEDINITSINITWNGSTGTTGENATSSIGIINDTNGNGMIDSGESALNTTTFNANDVAFLNLSYGDNNLTVLKGTTRSVLVYVNTTAVNLSDNSIVAVNLSNPSTDYKAIGLSSGKNITDYSDDEIPSSRQTAKFTGEVSVKGVALANNTIVKGSRTNVVLLGLNFSAVNESININSIKITASGSVNEANNITNVRLVNDSNRNGAYDGNDSVIALTEQKNFTDNNGNVTLVPSSPILVDGGSTKQILVIADTSTLFEPGENITLSLNNPKMDYNATGFFSQRKVEDPSTTPITNTTYIIGTISASHGTNTTATGPITAMAQNYLALLQINFSATHESMNITQINITELGTVNATTNLTGVGIVNDLNANGKIDSGEPVLNATTFDANNTANMLIGSANVTLATYNESLTSSGQNFTDGYRLAYAETIYAHITDDIKNETGWFGFFNLTVYYINQTGLTNITYFNTSTYSNLTSTWIPFNIGDRVLDIINITNSTTSTANATSGTIDIVATTRLNVTNGSSTNAIVYLNTSGNFSIGQTLKVGLLNLSTNYTATGIASGQTITDTSTGDITSNVLTGTGNLTVAIGANDTASRDINISTNNTNIVLWQLNFTAYVENVTISNITLTENGTANGATDISRVYLYYDNNSNGAIDLDESSIANSTIATDNGTVTFTSFSANNTIAVNTSKNYLVVVDTVTSNSFTDGETLAFNISKTGVNATGENSSRIVYNNFATDTISSNTTTGIGSIELYKGSTQPTTAYNASANYVAVLQLNFSAPHGAINITNITVKENGTAIAYPTTNYDFRNVSIVSDNDGDGAFNSSADTIYNNTANFTADNGTIVIETPGLIVGSTKNILIAVNTTSTISSGDTLKFEVNQTLGVGYNATGNVSGKRPYSVLNETINNSITVTGVPPTAYEIELKTGWNFISVPRRLNSSMDTAQEFLSGVPFITGYRYNASSGSWESFASNPSMPIEPLWGYWIEMSSDHTITLGFLDAPRMPPPSRDLVAGWNAIGFSDLTPLSANLTLSSISDSWNTLIEFDATNQRYNNSIIKGDTNPTSVHYDGTNMYPYKGYWVFMTKSGTLAALS